MRLRISGDDEPALPDEVIAVFVADQGEDEIAVRGGTGHEDQHPRLIIEVHVFVGRGPQTKFRLGRVLHESLSGWPGRCTRLPGHPSRRVA